jgi:hypothetical protein
MGDSYYITLPSIQKFFFYSEWLDLSCIPQMLKKFCRNKRQDLFTHKL